MTARTLQGILQWVSVLVDDDGLDSVTLDGDRRRVQEADVRQVLTRPLGVGKGRLPVQRHVADRTTPGVPNRLDRGEVERPEAVVLGEILPFAARGEVTRSSTAAHSSSCVPGPRVSRLLFSS